MAVKYSFKEICETATLLDGKCLSKEFKDISSPLKWRCKMGHTWEAPYSIVLQGGWCMACAKKQGVTKEKSKIKIVNRKKLKKQLVIRETTKKLHTNREKLKKQLSRREEFKILYFEKIKNIAEEKGGKCLSAQFINGTSKLKFECSRGHSWATAATNVVSGRWCRICAKINSIKLTIEEFQSLAIAKGGLCLSDIYEGPQANMKWQCSEGHQWETTGYRVKFGHAWCPVCCPDVHYTISDARNTAKSKGGKCLSTEYINNYTSMRWMCKAGHTWDYNYHTVLRGGWCPECPKVGTLEEIKAIARSKGGKCLSKNYVNWDLYLKFECAEGHKWEAKPGTIKNGNWCMICGGSARLDLKEFQKLAKEKGGKCLSKTYKNLKQKLEWECSEGHRWKCTGGSAKFQGTWCPACTGKINHTIEGICKFARRNGGKCLSKEYVNASLPLKWMCKNGHIWESTFNNVRQSDLFCIQCKKNKHLEEIYAIAKSKGGKCLSKEYFNNYTHLQFCCDKGHQWGAKANNIKTGYWCPVCGLTKNKKHSNSKMEPA